MESELEMDFHHPDGVKLFLHYMSMTMTTTNQTCPATQRAYTTTSPRGIGRSRPHHKHPNGRACLPRAKTTGPPATPRRPASVSTSTCRRRNNTGSSWRSAQPFAMTSSQMGGHAQCTSLRSRWPSGRALFGLDMRLCPVSYSDLALLTRDLKFPCLTGLFCLSAMPPTAVGPELDLELDHMETKNLPKPHRYNSSRRPPKLGEHPSS